MRRPAPAAWGAVSVAAVLAVAAAAQQPAGGPTLYLTNVGAGLVARGLAAPAPDGAAAVGFEPVPAPSVRAVPNVARATNIPWIDSNAWRFHRGLDKVRYDKLPAGSAPLAAAEAFTFGVHAILDPEPGDLEELGRLLEFLKAQDGPRLPALVNIGVVDHPSPLMGEVLNLLTRRNLLYRVVPAPDRALDLNVALGSADFPVESAANPNDFAERVRAKLGDAKRLVRVYGTSTVIARLTGDGSRARLYLLAFNLPRRQAGLPPPPNPQSLRVRVRGSYQPTKFAAYRATAGAELGDVRVGDGATEFWVPDFHISAIVDLEAAK